jgi:hypothetical protein
MPSLQAARAAEVAGNYPPTGVELACVGTYLPDLFARLGGRRYVPREMRARLAALLERMTNYDRAARPVIRYPCDVAAHAAE